MFGQWQSYFLKVLIFASETLQFSPYQMLILDFGFRFRYLKILFFVDLSYIFISLLSEGYSF